MLVLFSVARAAWEEVEEALFVQQAERVTGANLSILVETWGLPASESVSSKDLDHLSTVSATSPCIVLDVVMKAIHSWQKYNLHYLDRNGAGCRVHGPDITIENERSKSATQSKLDAPDVYVRIGRKYSSSFSWMGQSKVGTTGNYNSADSTFVGRLYNMLLLTGNEISSMVTNQSHLTETNMEEFSGIEQVILFSDGTKGTGASGHVTRNLASLFSSRQNMMPPAVSLVSEPRTGSEEEIISTVNTSFVSGVLDSQYRRYATANLAAMRSQLSWSSSIAIQNSRRSPSAKRLLKAVAIIVEPRIVPTFEFSVRNVMHHLLRSSSMSNVQWKLHVYSSGGPSGNERYVKSVLSDLPSALVKFIRLPRTFDRDGGRGYNQLFKSSSFWRRLITYGFTTAFVFQADSLLVDTSRLGEYLKYDFVGAPWMTKTSTSDKNGESPLYQLKCCNGGLSLRRIKSMYQIASEKRSLNPHLNEDVYFSSYTKEFGLLVPTSSHASNFSLEKPPPSNLMYKYDGGIRFEPVGLHAAWAYNDQAFIGELFDRSCTVLNVHCVPTNNL